MWAQTSHPQDSQTRRKKGARAHRDTGKGSQAHGRLVPHGCKLIRATHPLRWSLSKLSCSKGELAFRQRKKAGGYLSERDLVADEAKKG